MTTVAAILAPEAGRQVVDLTSWAGDADFTATPIAGDQIEGPDTLTINADGTITGPDGAYTLRHVQGDGTTEGLAYGLSNPDVTAPVLSNPAIAVDQYTITASVDTDEADGMLYALVSENASETAATIIASGQSYPVLSAGAQPVEFESLAASTTYYVHFVQVDAADNESNVITTTSVTTDTASATTTVQFVVGSNRNRATFAEPIDPYLFQEWSRLPVAGEQWLIANSAGTVYPDGTFETDLEAIFPVYFVELDGTTHRLTIDSTGLDGAIDTTPDDFQFTALTNQARSVPVTSNTVTIEGVDAAADVPVEITGGEWSKSTDGGNTWSLWNSDPGIVRLNNRVRLRHTTSNEYSSGGYNGVRETAITIGGRTRTFRSTTLADTVPPVLSLVGGNLNLVQGTPYEEPGYTATDNADGDITVTGVVVTGSINENQLGPQTLTYTATDRSGNVTQTTRTVTVVEFVPDDTTAPVISLVGGNRTLTVGDTWIDPGYTATDDVDGDLTAQVVVTGTVDTTRAGTYTLTYTVSDSTGNTGSTTRSVTVLPATQYPFDNPAPERRTYNAVRAHRPELGSKVYYLQAGETLDYDFDLTQWLAEQGDNVAEGSYEITELSDALQVMAIGTVSGQDRVKVWLRADSVKESEAVPVQLRITTTGYRVAVFQILMILIDRMH